MPALLIAGALIAGALPPTAGAAETPPAVPAMTTADPGAPLTFFVGLPYDDAGLAKAAKAVSEPTSTDYRQYLSPRQIAARFGASAASEQRLRTAAKSLGLTTAIDPSRLFARLTGTVATWEKLMGAPVNFMSAQVGVFFGLPANDSYVFSPDPQLTVVNGVPVPTAAAFSPTNYSPAPKALAKSITWFLPAHATYVASADTPPGATKVAARGRIHGFTYIDDTTPATPNPAPVNTGTPIGTSCIASNGVTIEGLSGATDQSGFFTPDQVSQAYGLESLQHNYGAAASGEVAIISLNGGFLQSDLQNAANCFGHHAPKVDIRRGTGVDTPFVNVDGETSLDLQTVAWTLKNARTIRLVQATNSATSFLDGYSTALSDPKGPPSAISLSYGSCESSSVGEPGWKTTEALFKTAAIAGTSLFVASGDLGSSACQAGDLLGAATVVGTILTNLGGATANQPVTDYLVGLLSNVLTAAELPDPTISYPASSPWVTAVGATQLVLGKGNVIVSQAVWNDLQFGWQGNAVSTGGTSSQMPTPWYQLPLTPINGRTVPDVSMLGAGTPGMALSVNGVFHVTGGTSEASPMLAAAITMVAQQRGQHLGFVNPWLYALGKAKTSAFLDVTRGNNQYPIPLSEHVTNVPACCQAVSGFDAATGLGAPNFAALAGADPH